MAPSASTVEPAVHSSIGVRSVTLPPSSTRPRCRPSVEALSTRWPDTSMRLWSPRRSTPKGSGRASVAKPVLSSVMLPPGTCRSPSTVSWRAAARVSAALGSSVSRAPSPTLSTPPPLTVALPLDCSVRLTGARCVSGAVQTLRPLDKWRALAWPARLAEASQLWPCRDKGVPGERLSPATPSRLTLAKPPTDSASGTRPSRPADGSLVAPGPIKISLARRLRLPPLAPCTARPRSVPPKVPPSLKGRPSRLPASASGVLLSSKLPADAPLIAPLAETRAPPDTSSSEPSPSVNPAPERNAMLPPALAALLATPSTSALTKRPDTSSVTPAATWMSPARLPARPTLRALVCSVRLPPALSMLRPSTMPSTPRAARLRLARSANSSGLPASTRRLPSLARLRLPKPAAASLAAAMRDSAGSAALVSGAAQKASSSGSVRALSRSDVSRPVPAKLALPKLPPLLRLPRRNTEAAASASRPWA